MLRVVQQLIIFKFDSSSSPFQKARTDSKSKITKNDVILVYVHESMNLSLRNLNFQNHFPKWFQHAKPISINNY